MKNLKKIAIFLLCTALILTMSACGKKSGSKTASAKTADIEEILNELKEESVSKPDTSKAAKISFSSDNAEISGSGAEYKNGVVTIKKGGVYILSGTSESGRVIVDAKGEEVTLVLNGLELSNKKSSSIYVYKSSKTMICLEENTKNVLSDPDSYDYSDNYSSSDDEEPNAALYSKSDLVIFGSGSLTVNGNCNNGITSKDTLLIMSSDITVTAKNHGINGKDYLKAKDAAITVTSGGDAVRSTNDKDENLGYIALVDCTLNLKSSEDGIQAQTLLGISGGKFDIVSGGGSSAKADNDTSSKGIKSGSALLIKDGEFTLDCCDDAVHSNGDVTISGGTFKITTGDDGVHSDSLLKVSGGNITVEKSYEGLEGAQIEISGGEINVTASDDGLNAAGGKDESGFGERKDNFASNSDYYIKITGGKINVNAYGDGIDSNGDLFVEGGETYVSGPVNDGNGAIDYDGTAKITGGIFVATGSSGMAMNFGSDSTQGSIMIDLDSQSQSAVVLKDSSSNEIVSFTPAKKYINVVVSAPSIVKGGTYTIVSGNLSKSVTLDSLIYGESRGMGGAAPNGNAPGGNAPGNGAAPDANGEQPSGNKPSDNGTQPPEKPDSSNENQTGNSDTNSRPDKKPDKKPDENGNSSQSSKKQKSSQSTESSQS